MFPSKSVTLKDGSSVIVYKLSALDALKLFRLIVKNLEAVKGIPYLRDPESKALVIDRSAFMALIPDLGEAFAEFVQMLTCKATRKSEAWLEEIEIEDLLEVLSVAIELNITEEIQKKIPTIAKNLFPKPPTPTTSSSESSKESSS